MNRRPLDWEQLAARVSLPADEVAAAPPPDLACRVLAVWQTLRRHEQLRRWIRWSLGGALASAAIVALAMAFQRPADPPILLAPPATPLHPPGFSAPPP